MMLRSGRRGLGRRGRGGLARRRRALGRVVLALVADANPVIPELVAPVLSGERPHLVLVVHADLVGALRARTLDELLLLDDLLLEGATLALQDLVLDLDD